MSEIYESSAKYKLMGMIDDSVKNSIELREKTKQIIENMIQNGEVINYHTVSKAAGVSRVFLYKYKEFRNIIESCRFLNVSKKELQKEIITLRRKIKDLESNQ